MEKPFISRSRFIKSSKDERHSKDEWTRGAKAARCVWWHQGADNGFSSSCPTTFAISRLCEFKLLEFKFMMKCHMFSHACHPDDPRLNDINKVSSSFLLFLFLMDEMLLSLFCAFGSEIFQDTRKRKLSFTGIVYKLCHEVLMSLSAFLNLQMRNLIFPKHTYPYIPQKFSISKWKKILHDIIFRQCYTTDELFCTSKKSSENSLNARGK